MISQRVWRLLSSGLGCILLVGIADLRAAQQNSAVEMEVSRHLAAAQKAEQERDYAAASRQYEEILKLQPELAIIRQSLAITYHLQNRYPEAIAEFRRALRIDSALWGCDLFLGMDYYKTNQFALALAPLEASIALNASMAEPEARFWLAVTYLALNKPEDAVRELRRDLALRPANIDVLYSLVKAYNQAAASSFERLGMVEPNTAAAALLEAEHFLEENRLDLARQQYRNALWLRPDFTGWIPALADKAAGPAAVSESPITSWDAHANLEFADLLASIGEIDQATAILTNLAHQKGTSPKTSAIIAEANGRIEALPQAQASNRRENSADIVKGIEAMKRGHFREAEEALARADEKNSNGMLQLLAMRACVESGDFLQVEDHLKQVLAMEPGNLDALLLMGRSYKQQAEATLQQMVEIDANSYGVHELLGRQHEEKTEYELAIKEYRAALEKRPDLAGIRYAVGNVYRKMSQYDEAEKWLLEELARNPYHGLAHYRLGSIYTEQGKADAAIPHLLEALRSHPQLTEAQLDLGRAYTAKGRYEEAVTALKHVAASDPDNDRVHYLLSLAYSKEGLRAEAQTELADYQRLTRDRLRRTQQDVKTLSNSLDQ